MARARAAAGAEWQSILSTFGLEMLAGEGGGDGTGEVGRAAAAKGRKRPLEKVPSGLLVWDLK